MKAERKWKMGKRIAVIVFIMGITLLAACSDTKTVSNQGEHDSQEEAEKRARQEMITVAKGRKKRKGRKKHLKRLNQQKMGIPWKKKNLKKDKKWKMTKQKGSVLLEE